MKIRKTINVIVSILIAIALWSYVIYAVEPTQTKTFTGVPVALENTEALADRNLAVAADDDVLIDVKVKGKRQIVSAMKNDEVHATADVSECIEGDNVVEVRLEFDRTVTPANNATITVHVNVEGIVTEPRNVVVTYSGDSENINYELTSESTVNVTGAKSSVEEVKEVAARVTEKDLPESDEEITVGLTPVNGSGEEIGGLTLSETKATVKISATGTTEVPLTVSTKGKPADGYQLTGVDAPSSIEIKGSNAALEGVAEIKCEDIDITDLKEDATVELKPELPDGTAIAGDSKITATVHIAKEDSINTISMSTDDIEILNLGEGLTAEIEKGDISVSSESDISESDVRLSVDLTDLAEGTHKVKIDVDAGDGVTVDLSVSEATVTISGE